MSVFKKYLEEGKLTRAAIAIRRGIDGSKKSISNIPSTIRKKASDGAKEIDSAWYALKGTPPPHPKANILKPHKKLASAASGLALGGAGLAGANIYNKKKQNAENYKWDLKFFEKKFEEKVGRKPGPKERQSFLDLRGSNSSKTSNATSKVIEATPEIIKNKAAIVNWSKEEARLQKLMNRRKYNK